MCMICLIQFLLINNVVTFVIMTWYNSCVFFISLKSIIADLSFEYDQNLNCRIVSLLFKSKYINYNNMY